MLTASAHHVRWDNLPPAIQARLEASGVTRSGFDARVALLANDAVRRVHEGDMDHLVFYVLQSTHITSQPPIEPALASREFVEWQNQGRRDGRLFPGSMESRVDEFLKAVDSRDRDVRLGYFRDLLEGIPRKDRKATIAAQFRRTMTFLYRQEFLSKGTMEVSRLYGYGV